MGLKKEAGKPYKTITFLKLSRVRQRKDFIIFKLSYRLVYLLNLKHTNMKEKAQFNQSQQDRELIAEVKKGNFNLLDGFYRANKSAFFKWIYKSYGLTAIESEDIFQDAFEVLFKKISLEKLDNLQASLKSYLFSVGKYMVYSKFRNQKTVSLEDNQNENQLFRNNQIQILPLEMDAEEHQLEVVMDCKKALSTSCQSILDWFYAEKKSMKEIALLLSYKNEDVAKSQKVRCLTELRKCVQARVKY
jgi:RNA polymerase sigma factor (sigma-70 family)